MTKKAYCLLVGAAVLVGVSAFGSFCIYSYSVYRSTSEGKPGRFTQFQLRGRLCVLDTAKGKLHCFVQGVGWREVDVSPPELPDFDETIGAAPSESDKTEQK